MMKKECIILSGLPATGKTTIRDRSIDDSYFVYSTDDLIETHAKETNSTYDAVFKEYYKTALKQANRELEIAIKDGKNIIWDQTNLGLRKRKKILAKLRQLGDFFIASYFIEKPDLENPVWNQRLNDRKDKKISKKGIQRMHGTYTIPTFAEDFDVIVYHSIEGKVYNMFAREVKGVHDSTPKLVQREKKLIHNKPKLII